MWIWILILFVLILTTFLSVIDKPKKQAIFFILQIYSDFLLDVILFLGILISMIISVAYSSPLLNKFTFYARNHMIRSCLLKEAAPRLLSEYPPFKQVLFCKVDSRLVFCNDRSFGDGEGIFFQESSRTCSDVIGTTYSDKVEHFEHLQDELLKALSASIYVSSYSRASIIRALGTILDVEGCNVVIASPGELIQYTDEMGGIIPHIIISGKDSLKPSMFYIKSGGHDIKCQIGLSSGRIGDPGYPGILRF